MRKNPLKRIVERQKAGEKIGIYSCCSSNPYVLQAALLYAKKTNSPLLIESTANQVDQFGGYSGLTPQKFREYVEDMAKSLGFDVNKLFLGGDHLGPLTFANKNENEAMELAKTLIHDYVLAGFSKIHIDTSMKVKDDDPNSRLSDATIAKRGAILAKVVKQAYQELLKKDADAYEPVLIVGSEVPIPGGQVGESLDSLQVTTVDDFKKTYDTFKKTFDEYEVSDMFDNIIGFVVQPGIEEKDSGCVEYDRLKASKLLQHLKEYNNIVFEGHSSDYQTKYKLKELVEDGVAILKVGPGLSYKAREGLFALAFVEKELYHGQESKQSHFMQELENAMLEDPKYWEKYYQGNDEERFLKRKYSFSDRCRYYMNKPKVQEAINKMFDNLKEGVPYHLLSQFFPKQYTKVREGEIENNPMSLVIDRIQETIEEYVFATSQQNL